MIEINTPLEHHPEFGLWVKREDLCCPGGPNFSKTRGVYAHVASRHEEVIGVLDTAHSQGGWAVAKACHLLNKGCIVFYPVRKREHNQPLKPQQQTAKELGADLIRLKAGRSAVLYHGAKKCLKPTAYMMPNALKLMESVEETALEVVRTRIPSSFQTIVVPASSGTIAAGVVRGAAMVGWQGTIIIHIGYSRPEGALLRYVQRMAGNSMGVTIKVVDENYSYADEARVGETPPWPCNTYYDLKSFRWWLAQGRQRYGQALFWNIG